METSYLLFKRKNILFWISLPILYLLSLMYNLVITVIKFSHRNNILPSYKSRLKVISVGNITLGGSGKTPIVEWLVDFLQRENKKAGVVIRGYKRPRVSYKGIVKDNSSYSEIGDEASIFKEKFKDIKIAVGQDKVHSLCLLEKEGCDVIILDDGFQHWRLKRDLDIVTIDASLKLQSQILLPLGRLREPLSSIRRVDIMCLTKIDISQENYLKNRELLLEINPKALIISSIYEPVCFCNLKTGSCAKLDLNKDILILSGIANPLYFEKMISELGLKIRKKLIYPDHYEYKKGDLDFIKKLAKDNEIDIIITTHKDAVRLRPFISTFENIDIFSLQIKLKITENEEIFRNRILSIFFS